MKRRRDCENTISLILGSSGEVLKFWDFVKKYAPVLEVTTPNTTVFAERRSAEKNSLSSATPEKTSAVEASLRQVLVAPAEGCTPFAKVSRVRRSQSLPTLVDDVVWALVQRRERMHRVNQGGSNLLCLGYKLGSDIGSWGVPGQPCRNMPLGVRLTHINSNVDYCKTSELFRTMHALVGDDVMRMMLMHCSIFVPANDKGCKRGNFMQVCGSPLQPRAPANGHEIHSQRKKRRKKTPALAERENPASSHVPRNGLLYADGFSRRVGLPSKHILNGPEDLEGLLDGLAQLRAVKGVRRRRHWLRVRDEGLRICCSLFRGHRSCPYKRLLEHYCPLPEICRGKVNEVTLADASASFTDANRVVSFVRSVITRVIPVDLFGSPCNWKVLLDHHVDWFVKLRRYETCPTNRLCHGMRVTKIPWLFTNRTGKSSSRCDHECASELLASALKWLFHQFIIPLLRTCFYVTECDFSGRQLLYYRKPAWSVFRSLSMKKLLNDQYIELTEQEAEVRLRHQELGLCRLRLLPKDKGVRPIAMLSKPVRLRLRAATMNSSDDSQFEDCADGAIEPVAARPIIDPLAYHSSRQSFPSTNRILDDALSVLQFEYSRRKELFGAGMYGLHYFYPNYRRFLQRRKLLGQNRTPIYFGSVDIDRCYDNINQDYMLDVLAHILSEDDYIVQRYEVIYPFASMSKVIRLRGKKVGPPDEFVPFYGSSCEVAKDHHRSILVDRVNCAVTRKDQLMKLLKEHLTGHIVVSNGRYGVRFLLQTKGIPQGSVLSSLLCNFYYGNVEQSLLPSLLDSLSTNCSDTDADASEHLLVRMVDDFMLVTSDVTKLKRFLRTMYHGNPALGVRVNQEKTKVSTQISFNISDGSICTIGGDPSFKVKDFSWCGMCFNIITGEVSIDYSRFHRARMRDTLTVEHAKKQGDRLGIAMKAFVRPRCLPILFDSTINGSMTQKINLYQLHVLAAVRSADYIRSSSILPLIDTNLSFLAACIDSTISYSVSLTNARLRQHDEGQKMRISSYQALWLGWKAFHDVLGRFSEFQGLTGRLRDRLNERSVPSHVHNAAAEGKRRIQIDCFF